MHNAGHDNLVIKSDETSKHFTWTEVSPKKVFTKSMSADRCRHPNPITGLVFQGALSKVLSMALCHLLILNAQANELTSFFSTVMLAKYVEVFFIGGVGQHGIKRRSWTPSVG